MDITEEDQQRLSYLIEEAWTRWLDPLDILDIIKNHNFFKLSANPPNKPEDGSLFLYDRYKLRRFRKDGYNWRKKKDGKSVAESHVHLKARNMDVLNCCYAHREDDEFFTRRCYWMLEKPHHNIILVHYRQTRFCSSPFSNFFRGVSISNQSQTVSFNQNHKGSNDSTGFYQSDWRSPGSVEEVSCNLISINDERDSGEDTQRNESSSFSMTDEHKTLTHQETFRLQEDIDDDIFPRAKRNISSWDNINPVLLSSDMQTSSRSFSNVEITTSSLQGSDYIPQHQKTWESNGGYADQWTMQDQGESVLSHQSFSPGKQDFEYCTNSSKDNILSSFPNNERSYDNQNLCDSTLQNSDIIKYLFDENEGNELQALPEKFQNGIYRMSGTLASDADILYNTRTSHGEMARGCQDVQPQNDGMFCNSNGPILMPPIVSPLSKNIEAQVPHEYLTGTNIALSEDSKKLKKSDSLDWFENVQISTDKLSLQSNYFESVFEQHVEAVSEKLAENFSMTVSRVQWFSIQETAPEWAYENGGAKIVIIGNFIGDPSKQTWYCMFGDIEVHAEVVRDGILTCKAPPHAAGKISFCITCGNRESCSEVREFEYRMKNPSISIDSSAESKDMKFALEELLLQIRFARLLLSVENSNTSSDAEGEIATGCSSISQTLDDNDWEQLEYAVGYHSHQQIKDRLIETLLKEKLFHWLRVKAHQGEKGASILDKHGQGVLHLAAALGYDWAISSVLNAGVIINFRDIHGWTALHWAAHFGREKTVVTLIAADASPEAVTDPTTKYPAGRIAADLASESGHGGIAGYLAEAALTSHLGSLTLGEDVLSKDSAAVKAERAVEALSARRSIQQIPGTTDYDLPLKDFLAATRNSALAAARIQAAFRAHSFSKRQRKFELTPDEYGITQADAQAISAASRLQRAFRNHRDQNRNKAAVCIQHKYRGWKGRRKFLTLRQHVVKIQAHVRGHQERKKYKFLWPVELYNKVVLRWFRRGPGLHVFKPKLPDGIDIDNDREEDDDEFLREFRKEKMLALDEAVSKVFHMIDSPKAQHQYRRILDIYQQVKEKYKANNGDSSAMHF